MFEDIQEFVRDSVMSIKVNQLQQADINKHFSVGDQCKVLIRFSAVWTIQGKHHATFNLEDIKKLDSSEFVNDW